MIEEMDKPLIQPSVNTLAHVLRERALKTPDKLAFCFLLNGEKEGPSLTYRELDKHASAIGAYLKDQELTGKQALLLFPPGIEFISAFFGCLYAGVTAVPAYPPKSNHHLLRLQSIIEDSESKAVLTVSSMMSRLARSSDENGLSALPCFAADSLVEYEGIVMKEQMPEADKLAFLQYTSGSTGTPKGVMVTHRNLMANLDLIRTAYMLNEDTPIASWLPVFHDMGLIGKVLTTVYNGTSCYLMSPLDFLQRPRKWLQAITKYKVYLSSAPNFAYDLCVHKVTEEDKQTLDLSSWAFAVNGAEPVRSETVKRFTNAFSGCGLAKHAVSPAYGMAESTLLISWKDRNLEPVVRALKSEALKDGEAVDAEELDNLKTEIVGCGKSAHGHQVVIADPQTGHVCPDNKVGEIWFKGPSVACGYWNRPEETSAAFGAFTAGNEGPFLRTGDLGFMRDGEVFVTGRMKDLLIFRGQNHYPQDLEFTLTSSHPALNHCNSAAFSVEENGAEKLVMVAEVNRDYRPLRSEADMEAGSARQPGPSSQSRKIPVSIDSIISAARQSISQVHQLQLADLVLIKKGSIPITSSGKIQRNACKAAYLQHQLALWAEPMPITSAVYKMEEAKS